MSARDGSLLFFDRLEDLSLDEISARIESLDGAQITDSVTDGMTEFWLDFHFRGHKFSVHNSMGQLWFFAEDALCPTLILNAITDAFGD